MVEEKNCVDILIVGDLIIDEHIFCEASRLNPEAPIPVCLKRSKEIILGGAGNVAKQIGAINGRATMTTISNNIPSGIEKLLEENNIEVHRLSSNVNFEIPRKQRIWANKQQQVCRIDTEAEISPFSSEDYERWTKEIIDIIHNNSNIRVVIFVDYDKGALTDGFIHNLSIELRAIGVYTILDPKRPTFHNIATVDVIKPNNKELESTGLSAVEASQNMPNTYLIITNGGKGMKAYKNGILKYTASGISVEVADVCGAGDVAAATFALIFVNKAINDNSIQYACKYANFASSRSVQHRGNYTLSKEEFDNIKGILK